MSKKKGSKSNLGDAKQVRIQIGSHSARRSRQLAMWFIMLLIPIASLGIVEMGLRIAGFGKDIPLFIENPAHPDYLLPRPDILQRYFNAQQLPPLRMEANFFLKQKPADGFRVVVQGGSTAAGFPYGLGASIAGMLDQRLRQTLPNRTVEVVNTSMSAINSYMLLDMADDIIAQQPDAIVIYAGHNEYLGLFGVGSSFSVGGRFITKAYFALYRLALVDALSQLLMPSKPAAEFSSRTFMSQVAGDKQIRLNSSRYEQGIEQFRDNMLALLDKYQRANIPVFISTVASNIADQKPFASTSSLNLETLTEQFGGSQRQSWDKQTLAKLKNTITQSDDANAHFWLAQQYQNVGEFKQAKQLFIQAKELDVLRFRAPEAINKTIRQLADSMDNVNLVDGYAAISKRSRGGIIGSNLMLEHLHPNVTGYFLIADAFYRTLMASPLVQDEQTTSHSGNPNVRMNSIEDAWKHRPIIASEEYFGYAQIQTLLADYPFSATPQKVALTSPQDPIQRLGYRYFRSEIDWVTMMRQARDIYLSQNNAAMILKTTQLLADALPHDGLVNMQCAELLAAQKRHAEARYYQQRAKRAGAAF